MFMQKCAKKVQNSTKSGADAEKKEGGTPKTCNVSPSCKENFR